MLIDEMSSDGKLRINKPVRVKGKYGRACQIVYENDMPDGTIITSPEPLTGEEYNEYFDKYLGGKEMEQFKNEEFSKADVTRDISGLSFAEVCKACMTQDKKAKVKLVLKTSKGTAKVKERLAIEWINLGSSKNVVCETLHVFGDGKFQVNGTAR